MTSFGVASLKSGGTLNAFGTNHAAIFPAKLQPGNVANPLNANSDGTNDVTADIQAFLDGPGCPDGSRILFPVNATYRCEKDLIIDVRKDLLFDGRGATVQATDTTPFSRVLGPPPSDGIGAIIRATTLTYLFDLSGSAVVEISASTIPANGPIAPFSLFKKTSLSWYVLCPGKLASSGRTSDFIQVITMTGNPTGGTFMLSSTSTSPPVTTDFMKLVTITGAPTGGTFTLSFGGNTTGTIAYNATATTVQTALRLLPGGPSTIVTGGERGPYTVRLPKAGATNLTSNGTGLTGGVSPNTFVLTGLPHNAPATVIQAAIRAWGNPYSGIIVQNPVQVATITGSPTGGTFTLTSTFEPSYGGGVRTTTPLAFNATGATVQTAIRAWGGVIYPSVTVTGPAGGPYVITLVNSIAVFTADDSGLTGGASPDVVFTGQIGSRNIINYTTGGGGVNSYTTDGTGLTGGASPDAVITPPNSTITMVIPTTLFNGNQAAIDALNPFNLTFISPDDQSRANFAVSNSTHIHFRNLTIIGANSTFASYRPDLEAQMGILFSFGNDGLEVANCSIHHQWGDNISFISGAGKPNKNVYVHDNFLDHATRQSVTVNGLTDALITRNTIQNPKRHIFDVEPNSSIATCARINIVDNDLKFGGLGLISFATYGGNNGADNTVFIGDFTLDGNRCTESMQMGVGIHHEYGPPQPRWGPFTFTNNTIGAQSNPGNVANPAIIKFTRCDHVIVTGNDMHPQDGTTRAGGPLWGVWLDDCGDFGKPLRNNGSLVLHQTTKIHGNDMTTSPPGGTILGEMGFQPAGVVLGNALLLGGGSFDAVGIAVAGPANFGIGLLDGGGDFSATGKGILHSYAEILGGGDFSAVGGVALSLGFGKGTINGGGNFHAHGSGLSEDRLDGQWRADAISMRGPGWDETTWDAHEWGGLG